MRTPLLRSALLLLPLAAACSASQPPRIIGDWIAPTLEGPRRALTLRADGTGHFSAGQAKYNPVAWAYQPRSEELTLFLPGQADLSALRAGVGSGNPILVNESAWMVVYRVSANTLCIPFNGLNFFSPDPRHRWALSRSPSPPAEWSSENRLCSWRP